MKITTDTPELLIVDDKPIILGIALTVFILIFAGIGLGLMFSGEWWGLVFLVVGGGLGLGAFWAFVRRVQVVFHRPDGYVEFRRRNIFSGSTLRFELAEISRAEIEESRSNEGGATWRVVLVIDEGQNVGRYPITLAYSNGGGHHRAADAINDWLSAGRGSMRVEV